MGRIPPPGNPRHSNVDWKRLEQHVGLTYPRSFKDFINVYGGRVWFGNISPFFSECRTDDDAKQFVVSIERKLQQIESNTYDEDFNEIQPSLYPERGGLLPFMIDYAGNMFLWRTDSRNSDEWPIAFWNMGPITILEDWTIAKMIWQWLQRDPVMIKVWGDINEYEPDRIRLTES